MEIVKKRSDVVMFYFVYDFGSGVDDTLKLLEAVGR